MVAIIKLGHTLTAIPGNPVTSAGWNADHEITDDVDLGAYDLTTTGDITAGNIKVGDFMGQCERPLMPLRYLDAINPPIPILTEKVAPTIFDANSSSYIATGALRNGNFVVAYADSGDGGKGKFFIYDRDGNTIAGPTTFELGSTSSITITLLENGNFVIGYSDGGNGFFGTVVVYDEDGNLVNGPTIFNAFSSSRIYSTTLLNGNVVFSYTSSGEANKVKFTIYNPSTDAVVTSSFLDNEGGSYIDCCSLPNGNVMFAYRETISTNGRYAIYDEEGSQILAPTTFNVGSTYYNWLITLKSGDVMLAFHDGADGGKGKTIILDQDGNILQAEATFEAGDTRYITGGKLSNDNVVLSFHDFGDSNIAKFIVLNQYGDVINSASDISTGDSEFAYSSAGFDNHVIVAFRDDADGNKVKYAIWDTRGVGDGTATLIGGVLDFAGANPGVISSSGNGTIGFANDNLNNIGTLTATTITDGDFSVTSGAFTGVDSIVIDDGGTIGQVAGPLLTFDDTNNYLEITGCDVVIGGVVPVGKLHVEDNIIGEAKLIVKNNYYNSTAPTVALDFRGYANGNAGKIVSVRENLYNEGSGSWTSALDFYTAFEGTNNRHMRIDSAGDVGVNTIIPAAKFHVVGTTRLGDYETNYVETSTTGDLFFVGGAGLPYGCIDGVDETVACTVQNTWYQVTFDTAGPVNLVEADVANNELEISKEGDYNISITACLHTGNAQDMELMVKKNDGTADVGIHLYQSTGVAGKIENLSGSCMVDLTGASDRVELWVRCTSSATINAIFDHVSLGVLQVGG